MRCVRADFCRMCNNNINIIDSKQCCHLIHTLGHAFDLDCEGIVALH